jgi:hypothetical protein
VSGGEEEVSGGGEEDTSEKFDQWLGGREQLGDEDYDGEDEDGGEELDEMATMTSISSRDEFDEARGRARGMARSNDWIRDGVGKLLKAASGCDRGSVGPGVEPALIYVSAGRCWRWS